MARAADFTFIHIRRLTLVIVMDAPVAYPSVESA